MSETIYGKLGGASAADNETAGASEGILGSADHSLAGSTPAPVASAAHNFMPGTLLQDIEATSAATSALSFDGELCGAPAVGGPCTLWNGHNMGRLDIPQNHHCGAATSEPSTRDALIADLIKTRVPKVSETPETDDLKAELKLRHANYGEAAQAFIGKARDLERRLRAAESVPTKYKRMEHNARLQKALEAAERELAAAKADLAQRDAEISALRAALLECTDDFEEYAQYAGEYLMKKHDTAGTAKRYRDLVKGSKT